MELLQSVVGDILLAHGLSLVPFSIIPTAIPIFTLRSVDVDFNGSFIMLAS